MSSYQGRFCTPYSLTHYRHSKKLFALAAQKFVADIATDAFQFNQVKQSSRATSKSNKVNKHETWDLFGVHY